MTRRYIQQAFWQSISVHLMSDVLASRFEARLRSAQNEESRLPMVEKAVVWDGWSCEAVGGLGRSGSQM